MSAPNQLSSSVVGFAPEEIRTDEPTRSARLKWVVVVDEQLPAGRAVNAAACVAAATSTAVAGLLGPQVTDTSGGVHPGLPWAGCTVLGASVAQLSAIRAKAADSLGVFVADMPAAGQSTRVYDEYLRQVGETDGGDIEYHALSLVGPRNRIDKLVHRLGLLG